MIEEYYAYMKSSNSAVISFCLKQHLHGYYTDTQTASSLACSAKINSQCFTVSLQFIPPALRHSCYVHIN